MVIAQNESIITIDNVSYALDGSEAKGVLSTQTATVAWISSALMITKRTVSAQGNWRDVETYSLNGEGNLVVVRISAMVIPNSMQTSVAVYKRA